jgi:hypothetical protein
MRISQGIIFFVLVGAIVLGGVGVAITRVGQQDKVYDFESCVLAGNPVMESDPRKCRHVDGSVFVEFELSVTQPNANASTSTQKENTLPGVVSDGCVRSGCSGQFCVPKEYDHTAFTICDWQPWYGCFIDATCERQFDGSCGWTETETLRTCLEQNTQ